MTGRLDKLIDDCEEFEWDEGNREKNWKTHQVTTQEIEDVFINVPLVITEDTQHSQAEARYRLLGQTNSGRKLFISFTIRNYKIRVISARNQNHKERRVYEQKI